MSRARLRPLSIPASIMTRFAETSALLASVRDIVDERSDGRAPPSWGERRGWMPFLDALSTDAVLSAGRDGLAPHLATLADAPDDLVQLAREVTRLTTLPAAAESAGVHVDPRRASPRKRTQVAAFAALTRRLTHPSARVVDVGSGHGHLTRHLARALGVPAEGWERDPDRVAVAESLTADGAARFVTMDAREGVTALRPTDLVVGLHACGELGDYAVRAASEAGAAVAIIGCCLQKRPGERVPLIVPADIPAQALTLGRWVLGFGNARDTDELDDPDAATYTAARMKRMALRTALRAAGHDLRRGEEMRGINRRRALGPFQELADFAFASRGIPLPSDRAIAEAWRRATIDYERAQRWELPRTMLARLVEVWAALDRAAFLTTRGYAADVVLAFGTDASPRNLAVLAERTR